MGQTYAEISPKLQEWIAQQPLYFVGTAPSGSEGHINISPKGARESFAVLGPNTVAYVDMTGSGAETIAHLRDNGRIVVMFCAFDGPPKIVRLHGTGTILLHPEPEFEAALAEFPLDPAAKALARAVIVVEVERVSDSCGYVVPIMKYDREREQMYRWAENREAKEGPGWWDAYKRKKNAVSIDGLPALDPTPELAVTEG
jgi:hypothetical protein